MGQTLKVRVDRIAPEGDGIAAMPGDRKLVFVPHAVPGDLLEVQQTEAKDRFLRARALRVLEPAPGRVEPPCPYHFKPGRERYCGGCDWQQAGYAEQLKLKRDVVVDCMRRIARLDVKVEATVPSPLEWRYRNKVQVPFQPSRGGKGFAAGFYSPGTHEAVDFEDCLVQPELSVAIVQTVRRLTAQLKWEPYDEDKDRGWLRHLYIRTNTKGEALVAFITRQPGFPREKEAVAELLKAHPRIVSVWQNLQERRTSVILGRSWRKLAGRERMMETIGRLDLEFSPGAFLQVNTPAAEKLYTLAEELLFDGAFAPRLVLDLYCGVGAIALWLAPRVEQVIGIEEVLPAVEDAYYNARRLKLDNVQYVHGRAELAVKKLRGLDAKGPWAAVVDPPRAGCERAVLEFLAQRKMERIVYISCNPATFARDARVLADKGYDLKKVTPLDLFPQTSHVELAAQFNRRGR